MLSAVLSRPQSLGVVPPAGQWTTTTTTTTTTAGERAGYGYCTVRYRRRDAGLDAGWIANKPTPGYFKCNFVCTDALTQPLQASLPLSHPLPFSFLFTSTCLMSEVVRALTRGFVDGAAVPLIYGRLGHAKEEILPGSCTSAIP